MSSDPNQWREAKLQEFVAWCKQHITGDEKGEAQTFIDHLFVAFGQKGAREVGGTFEERVTQLFDEHKKTRFADYVWKGVVLIEMKKRGADLAKHRQQAFDYWTHIAPGKPKYVVLCNFDEFWVYDFANQIYTPKDKVALVDLPTKWGPLAFLFPTKEEPSFGNDREKVTREAADKLAACFTKMVTRGVDRDLAQRFVLQSMIAMFAEDIGLLPRYFFSNLIKECEKPEDSYDKLGGLFEAMNTNPPVAGGRYKGVRYFNGGIFRQPARVELYPDELVQLRGNDGKLFGAVQSDWSKVEPEIFGAIFQDSMNAEERHAFGAHFTSAEDIMKIVKPTISDPWTDAIRRAKTAAELNELLERLATLRVLDPACGSGNFLYLAYREMKRLETTIRDRLAADFPKAPVSFAHVSARQYYGMDINPFAVELAKITLMIARKLAINELHLDNEPDLPLYNLDANFVVGDALIRPLTPKPLEPHPDLPPPTDLSDPPTGDYAKHVAASLYERTPWPAADVIIGNPPFLGAKRLKPERGADYVNAVRKLYPEVPGMADYCVYWIRRAADHLPECTAADPFAGRAGLVGTQNIRNNQSRVGGLDHVVKSGTIVEAVDNQPWSGDANVHVSIANWMKTQASALVPKKKRLWRESKTRKVSVKRQKGVRADKLCDLVAEVTDSITPVLSSMTEAATAATLECNRDPQRVFQGVTPGYSGFVLETADRWALINADRSSEHLIRPYMIGRELVSGDGTPGRYLIDGDALDLLSLTRYKAIQKHLQEKVLPFVEAKLKQEQDNKSDMIKAREEHLNRWWTFWARRKELRNWLKSHQRIIASSRTQRWPFVFTFISSEILPGDKLQLFAFDDDYSFGIVHSQPHCA